MNELVFGESCVTKLSKRKELVYLRIFKVLTYEMVGKGSFGGRGIWTEKKKRI